jgi:hypothetical protein
MYPILRVEIHFFRLKISHFPDYNSKRKGENIRTLAVSYN